MVVGYVVRVTQPRHMSSTLNVTVSQPADLVFSVAVSSEYPSVDETLTFRVDGVDVPFEEVTALNGSRLHHLRETPVGNLVVDYAATVHGEAPEPPILASTRSCSPARPGTATRTGWPTCRRPTSPA